MQPETIRMSVLIRPYISLVSAVSFELCTLGCIQVNSAKVVLTISFCLLWIDCCLKVTISYMKPECAETHLLYISLKQLLRFMEIVFQCTHVGSVFIWKWFSIINLCLCSHYWSRLPRKSFSGLLSLISQPIFKIWSMSSISYKLMYFWEASRYN